MPLPEGVTCDASLWTAGFDIATISENDYRFLSDRARSRRRIRSDQYQPPGPAAVTRLPTPAPPAGPTAAFAGLGGLTGHRAQVVTGGPDAYVRAPCGATECVSYIRAATRLPDAAVITAMVQMARQAGSSPDVASWLNGETQDRSVSLAAMEKLFLCLA